MVKGTLPTYLNSPLTRTRTSGFWEEINVLPLTRDDRLWEFAGVVQRTTTKKQVNPTSTHAALPIYSTPTERCWTNLPSHLKTIPRADSVSTPIPHSSGQLSKSGVNTCNRWVTSLMGIFQQLTAKPVSFQTII